MPVVVALALMVAALGGPAPQPAPVLTSSPEDCAIFVVLLREHVHYKGVPIELPILTEDPPYDAHPSYRVTCNWAANGWPRLKTEGDPFAYRPYLQLGRPAFNRSHDEATVDITYQGGPMMMHSEICTLRRQPRGWRVVGCRIGAIS
jgi:hypothetical protein